MPQYCFRCTGCPRQVTVMRTISERDDAPLCPGCACPMERDLVAEGTNTPLKDFHKPIEMYSIAPENPQQLADLRRKCPDVTFNDQLVPLAHNRAEKLRILKAVGAVELS